MNLFTVPAMNYPCLVVQPNQEQFLEFSFTSPDAALGVHGLYLGCYLGQENAVKQEDALDGILVTELDLIRGEVKESILRERESAEDFNGRMMADKFRNSYLLRSRERIVIRVYNLYPEPAMVRFYVQAAPVPGDILKD